MLIGDVTKWLGVVLGVFLCTFLICHMLSMFSGMMERSFALVTDIPQADIWVMDPAVQYVDEPIGMPDGALQRVRGTPGVLWAVPLHTSTLRARLPSGAFQGVLLVGVDDATLIGAPERIVEGRATDLRTYEVAIVDTLSANTSLRIPVEIPHPLPGYQPLDFSGPSRPLRVGDELLVNDHRLIVGGLADLGPRFISKPVVYTTYSRALQVNPPQRNLLSFVLVKAAPGTDAAALAASIFERTGLRARTSAQFADDTYWYYVKMTGVVDRIMFMISVAVVVGVSVSALLFYMFTMENSRYYAVLKALGATDRRLVAMVVLQSLFSSAVGYGLGVGASCAFGLTASSNTMPYKAVAGTFLFAAAAVLLVAVISATLSMLRVRRLEPGIVFRA
jgi:putative ABC transport system permease protein